MTHLLSRQINTRLQRIMPYVTLLLIGAMLCVGVFIYGASFSGQLIFAGFILFFVLLPGMFIIDSLSFDSIHFSTRIALGFFSGWCLITLVYFISDALRTNILLYSVGPVLSAAYCIGLIRKKNRGLAIRRINFCQVSVNFYLFLLLILLYCLINTQYIYVSPSLSDFTILNPDKAYHMGLANSLSHDYPLESPWLQGFIIYYHYFSELLFSIPIRLFNLDADFIAMSCSPYLTAFCFGLSLYSFFSEMSSRPKRAGLYCLVVLLSNIYITKNISASLGFKFVLINDNAAGYGIAAVLMTIVLFDHWYEAFINHSEKRLPLLILLTAFIMLTAGIKGPMGAVCIASIWGVYILGLIMRKVPFKTCLPIILMTAGFILIYYVILGSKGQSNASGNSMFEFATITDIAFWKKPLVLFLKSLSIPGPVRLGIVLIVFMMFFFTAFFLPFCIGYVRELVLVLSGRKEFNFTRIIVYAAAAAGFIALFILNYSGHSQVYFGLVTAFLAPIIAFWFFEDMEERKSSSKPAKLIYNITITIFVIVLACTSVTLVRYYDTHIHDSISKSDRHQSCDMYTSISKDEYEAMKWIDENTEEDALLATDRYYSVSPDDYSYENRWANRYFLYAVYSNRFCYIAGSGYNLPRNDWSVRKEMIETNDKLYDENFDERGALARDLDVDYVVVSKRFTDVGDLSNRDYSICYSNDEVVVYEIAD